MKFGSCFGFLALVDLLSSFGGAGGGSFLGVAPVGTSATAVLGSSGGSLGIIRSKMSGGGVSWGFGAFALGLM